MMPMIWGRGGGEGGGVGRVGWRKERRGRVGDEGREEGKRSSERKEEEGRSYIRPLKLGYFADACFRFSNMYYDT